MRTTCPVPLHVEQVLGDVPAFAPDPWHDLQLPCFVISTFFSVPKAASEKEIVTSSLRSAPVCSRCPPPPPKKSWKMSLKSGLIYDMVLNTFWFRF